MAPSTPGPHCGLPMGRPPRAKHRLPLPGCPARRACPRVCCVTSVVAWPRTSTCAAWPRPRFSRSSADGRSQRFRWPVAAMVETATTCAHAGHPNPNQAPATTASASSLLLADRPYKARDARRPRGRSTVRAALTLAPAVISLPFCRNRRLPRFSLRVAPHVHAETSEKLAVHPQPPHTRTHTLTTPTMRVRCERDLF